MKICDQHIKTSEIIGIGPLMIMAKPNSVYQERKYSFDLYLRHQTIKIESDWVTPHSGEERKQKDEKYMQDFKKSYEYNKQEILKLVCPEEEPNTFQWTDELVMEFCNNYEPTVKGIHWTSEDIENFKKTKLIW